MLEWNLKFVLFDWLHKRLKNRLFSARYRWLLLLKILLILVLSDCSQKLSTICCLLRIWSEVVGALYSCNIGQIVVEFSESAKLFPSVIMRKKAIKIRFLSFFCLNIMIVVIEYNKCLMGDCCIDSCRYHLGFF